MAHISSHARAQQGFDPTPSLTPTHKTKIVTAKTVPSGVPCVGVPVTSDGDVPTEVGLDRAALTAMGFTGKLGETLLLRPPGQGPTIVVFGIGTRADVDAASLRDGAASLARAAAPYERLAIQLSAAAVHPKLAAQAVVEGAVLARYQFQLRGKTAPPRSLVELVIVGGADADIKQGAELGGITSRAVELARDLAASPASLLTARRMAEIAQQLAKECGLGIEVFDEDDLEQLGCGGLLGVNAGSVEPPRMIKLTYQPKGTPTGDVALIAKGIMFDSGGLGIKPNDLVHATMKGDMSGAAAVLAAMTTLRALACTTAVTGYLMCTDNMPSGTAMKLGDVLTVRGGRTVEVINTDAEGRLVMADALVLATEQDPRPDAIVDIATLTGACQRALGGLCAGVLGNHPGLVEQVAASAARTDEAVWQLPLEKKYRRELDSELADLKNVGGVDAGAITAGLFLEEFVDGIPWAHLDIAGTARVDADVTWRPRGPTGFGARLLIDLLTTFKPPARA